MRNLVKCFLKIKINNINYRPNGVWRRSDSPTPCKNSSDLYQFLERPLVKVEWTCPLQSIPWRRPCILTPVHV